MDSRTLANFQFLLDSLILLLLTCELFLFTFNYKTIYYTYCAHYYFNSIIEDFAISKDESTLWVICKNVDPNAIKPYLLAEIKIENNKFVHNNLGSFFKNDGAKKQFTLLQGLEWTEGDTFDDFS